VKIKISPSLQLWSNLVLWL